MQKEIRHEWFFPQSQETIWEYLTDSEMLSLWLMPNDFQPVQGHKFMFKIPPVQSLNFDGQIFCEVLDINPKSKVVYSWKYGTGDGTMRVDSLVEWTLSAGDGGTNLKLVHSGLELPKNLIDYEAMNGGWLSNVKKIEKHLLAKTV